MTRFEDAPIDGIVSDYKIGSTISEISMKYGIPFRTIHSWLVKLNIPRRNGGIPKGYKFSEERNNKIAESRRGFKMPESAKRKISEINSCHYNGLNGYWHIKRHNGGYEQAYCPDHPNAHADGYVMFHTVLMERHIGRYLNKDEVVHHINGNRSDNRIENLMLMNKKEHMSMHMKKRHEQRRKESCNALS